MTPAASSAAAPEERARPLLIAHRFGNEIALVREADAAGVDLIEIDVWRHRGRLEVRHLKTLGPIPLLWDRWRLASALTPRLLLHRLVQETSPATELMLDLKGGDRALPGAVITTMQAELPGHRYWVCSQSWTLLEQFRDVPDVRVVHSVGDERMLRQVARRLTWHDDHAISINRRLLDPDRVRRLREQVPTLMTWAVNTRAEADRLVAWGVNGLISDDLDLLRQLAGAGPGPAA